MVRQTDKFMCIDRGILLSHKKDKILLFTTWMVLEVTEPGLIQVLSFMGHKEKKQMNKQNKTNS